MVTMDTTPDYVMYIENIEQALEHMEQAIRQNIRKVDICTRYSSMQYLIILFEADETKISKVMDRIFMQYYKQYDKSNFIPKYEYIPMMEDREEQWLHHCLFEDFTKKYGCKKLTFLLYYNYSIGWSKRYTTEWSAKIESSFSR